MRLPVISSAPLRRPAADGPRVGRPSGYLGRAPSRRRLLFLRALWRVNRWLRVLPTGPGLARRIDCEREYATVEVRLARGGAGLDGLRVAYVSDLHAGSFLGDADVRAIFGEVARLEPDLVCLGGDLVEEPGLDAARALADALAPLSPPLGIFAVPGNHEYFVREDFEAFQRLLEERGVTLLVNRGVRVTRGGSSLWIAGVDDLSLGLPDLGAALRDARDHEPVLLLSHHPDLFREAAWAGVDLTLSGHTHAGQIVLLGRRAIRRSYLGYDRGWFEEGGAQLYVGRGAGVTGVPLRVGAPAEVPIVQLSTAPARPAVPGV